MKYGYTGPGPIETQGPGPHGGLVIVRPGDVWEWAEEPAFGRWEPIEGEGSEEPSGATGGTPPQQSPANEAENAPTGEPEPHEHKEA